MSRGFISAIFGLFGVALIVIVGLSNNNDDRVVGPLTSAISLLISSENITTVSEMKAVGYFDLYEENLRFLLSLLLVIVAALSGTLAVIASKVETNSLWYSIGVFASASALAELSHIGAIIFMVVCGWLIMRNRKWKMTQA